MMDFLADRRAYWQALRGFGPVVRVGSKYCLTRRADVVAALRDPDAFTYPGSPESYADRQEHLRRRRRLEPLLGPRAVNEMRPALRKLAADLLDAVAVKGRCDGITDVAAPFAGQVISAVFGLKDRDWDDVNFASPEARAYLTGAVHEQRRNPTSGVVSKLVSGDDPLDDDDAVATLAVLFYAAFRPVVAAIGFALLELSRNAALRCQLCEDPERIAGFVEEILRREPPIPAVARKTTQDVTVSGVKVPAGSQLDLCLAAIGLEGGDGGQAGRAHWAFGGGAHRCVGSHLARAELAVIVAEWLRRIPDFELDADSIPPVVVKVGLERVVMLSSLPLRWGERGRRAREV